MEMDIGCLAFSVRAIKRLDNPAIDYVENNCMLSRNESSKMHEAGVYCGTRYDGIARGSITRLHVQRHEILAAILWQRSD